ncbi:MAG: dihydrodipicolinate synthase family protein [Solirubrobacteraceae bacterium]|nr:dihydrodipicolinate synthase family protein [Solirubrobacteraceae bacterium]
MILYEGLFHVLVTPFDVDGRVDAQSLRRLVEFAVGAGARGLTALGVNGEAAHLDDHERDLVLDTVLEVVGGRVPVVVGVSDPDTRVAAARAARAAQAGAAALMLAVPPEVDRLRSHLEVVASAASGLDVVLQDYPASGHPRVAADVLAAAAREVSSVRAVKAEDPPTPAKIAELAGLAPNVAQLGGLGGLWLLWELRAGARGTMTGFAFPEALAAIVADAASGDWESARSRYVDALPALVWEAQPAVGLLLRKTLLARRGLIDTALLRAPAPAVPDAAAQAAEIAARFGRGA